MQLAHYLELARVAELDLADALRQVSAAYPDETDVHLTGRLCASWCEEAAEALGPFCERYRAAAPAPPEELHADLFHGPRSGGIGLLRDLQDLYLQACDVDITYTMVRQAAKAARDTELDDAVTASDAQTTRTLQWLTTLLKTTAPQALVVA